MGMLTRAKAKDTGVAPVVQPLPPTRRKKKPTVETPLSHPPPPPPSPALILPQRESQQSPSSPTEPANKQARPIETPKKQAPPQPPSPLTQESASKRGFRMSFYQLKKQIEAEEEEREEENRKERESKAKAAEAGKQSLIRIRRAEGPRFTLLSAKTVVQTLKPIASLLASTLPSLTGQSIQGASTATSLATPSAATPSGTPSSATPLEKDPPEQPLETRDTSRRDNKLENTATKTTATTNGIATANTRGNTTVIATEEENTNPGYNYNIYAYDPYEDTEFMDHRIPRNNYGSQRRTHNTRGLEQSTADLRANEEWLLDKTGRAKMQAAGQNSLKIVIKKAQKQTVTTGTPSPRKQLTKDVSPTQHTPENSSNTAVQDTPNSELPFFECESPPEDSDNQHLESLSSFDSHDALPSPLPVPFKIPFETSDELAVDELSEVKEPQKTQSAAREETMQTTDNSGNSTALERSNNNSARAITFSEQVDSGLICESLAQLSPQHQYPISPVEMWNASRNIKKGTTCTVAWAFDNQERMNVSVGKVTSVYKRKGSGRLSLQYTGILGH